jgi:uncharacterized Zn finger protein (UPF0148 family)
MHGNRNYERKERSRKMREDEDQPSRMSGRSKRRRGRKLVQNGICPDCGSILQRVGGHYECPTCPGISISRALSA